MTAANQAPEETRPPTVGGSWPWVLPVLVWLPLLWRLSVMWRSETEQLFGFGVPVLVAWLMWQRRRDWLLASAPARGANGVMATGAMVLGAAVLALEANPLWPTAAWLGVGGGVMLTLAVIARGHGWRGARAAAPVLMLMFTALKWPTLVYVPIMTGLMQVNAVIAAELVSLLGTPAMVHGNVIEVARGMVGVDDACSGLRSLQTVVMMAFFLGESDRWRAGRRIALLGGAVLAALVVNVARTTVLTWAFGRLGPDVEERWHDPAGVIALIVTLLLVWFCSERLNRAAPVTPAAANGSVMGAPAWRPLLLALVCVGIIEAGTQAWYGWHERGGPGQRVSWELKPANDSGWAPVEVPPRSAEILRYESGDSYARELSMPSRQMLAFAFRWSGDLAQIGAPEAHNPLICLPAVGAVEEAELPEARVVVDGVEVAFRFVRFRQGDRLQHVWFSLWSTRTGHADTARLLTNDIAELRLSRVLAGVRNDEREQLIFFVQGESDDAGAAQTLHDAVLTLMRRQSFVRP